MPRAMKILCIDDQQDFLDTLQLLLRSKGHETAVSRSGKDAARLIAETGADVLVVDYVMPDMNGVETVRLVRDAGHKLPILMLTVFLEEGLVASLKPYSISGYVSKMGDLSDLVEILGRLREAKGA